MKILTQLFNILFPYKCIACNIEIDLNHIYPSKLDSKMEFEENLPIRNQICSEVKESTKSTDKLSRELEFSKKFNICFECKNKLVFDTSEDSVFIYNDFLYKLIRNFKYFGDNKIAMYFAIQMCEKFHAKINNSDIIIPVPMHPVKQIFRLYNQSALLVEMICKIMNKKYSMFALKKISYTKSQTSLKRSQRIENIVGSIGLNFCTKGKKILLVDDVLTTGSTIRECIKILSDSDSVNAITIARATQN